MVGPRILVNFFSKIKVKHSGNYVDHLLSLFIMDNILPNIAKFNYDKKFLGALVKNKDKKKAKKKGKHNQTEFMEFLLNKNFRTNFQKFETKFLAMIQYLLNINSEYKRFLFTHILKTIMIYGVNQPRDAGSETRDSGEMSKTVSKKTVSHIQRTGHGSSQQTEIIEMILENKLIVNDLGSLQGKD